MQFRTLGQIYVDAYRAREWFKSVGIPTASSRIDRILNYIDGLLNPTVGSNDPLGAHATPEDTFHALSDGAGFGLIASQMSKLPSHLLPRQTLRDIIKGTLAASAENQASNDARNKFVELELGANLSSAGFQILGFDDLRFGFEGHPYQVECKRPSHGGTLDNNIDKAYRQVSARLRSSSDRGIVAVAVEKVLELDSRIHPAALTHSPSALARCFAEEFRTKVSKYQYRWVDTRVVGVLAVIRFLTTTKDPATIGSSYNLALIKFTSAQPLDDSRSDRLIALLRGKFLET
jgi:hypothetical protein